MELLPGEGEGRWEDRQAPAPRPGTVQEDVAVQHTLVSGVLGGGGMSLGQFRQLRPTETLHFKTAHVFCYSSHRFVFYRMESEPNATKQNVFPAIVEINPMRSSPATDAALLVENPPVESTSTTPA